MASIPTTRRAVDLGSVADQLSASPTSTWQTRLYTVSRWTCGDEPEKQGDRNLWMRLAAYFGERFPQQQSLTMAELVKVIGSLSNALEASTSRHSEPKSNDLDVVEVDLLAHTWCSVVAALAPLPSPSPFTSPEVPSLNDLESFFRRNSDLIGAATGTQPDPLACATAVSRILNSTEAQLRERCERAFMRLTSEDSVTTFLVVESMLHTFGFAGTAVEMTDGGGLKVVVEWARAADLVPTHEVTTVRRRQSVTDRPASDRSDELGRQLVRYLTAVARIALAAAPTTPDVEVIAVAPGSLGNGGDVVAQMTLDRPRHEGIERRYSGWLNDWMQLVEVFHDTGAVAGRQLARFIKSHGERLSEADALLMSDVGPLITIGGRDEGGDLIPFASLRNVIANPSLIQTDPPPDLGAGAPMFGLLFWLDVDIRHQLIESDRARDEQQRREAAQRAAQRQASPPTRTAPQPAAPPRVRPRLNTQTPPNP